MYYFTTTLVFIDYLLLSWLFLNFLQIIFIHMLVDSLYIYSFNQQSW